MNERAVVMKEILEEQTHTLENGKCLVVVCDSYVGKGINGMAEKKLYIGKVRQKPVTQLFDKVFFRNVTFHKDYFVVTHGTVANKAVTTYMPYDLVKYIEIVNTGV